METDINVGILALAAAAALRYDIPIDVALDRAAIVLQRGDVIPSWSVQLERMKGL